MRLRYLLPLLLVSVLHAQTVALPATGVTLIGAEGITITATTGTNVAYYFGAGTTYNLVKSLKLPALVNCSSATSAGCVALGGDPAPGVAKSIYAVQQSAAFTVTTSASTTPVPVPALPVTPPPPPPANTTTTYTATCTVPVTVTLTTTSGSTTEAIAVTGTISCPAVVQ